MHVGRGEVDIAQCGRFEWGCGAARERRLGRANVIGLPISEKPVRGVAGGAGPVAKPGKFGIEQYLTAFRSLRGLVSQPPGLVYLWVGQKVKGAQVGDHRIELERRWLRSGKLGHDHIAYKTAQARLAPITPVRRCKADASH